MEYKYVFVCPDSADYKVMYAGINESSFTRLCPVKILTHNFWEQLLNCKLSPLKSFNYKSITFRYIKEKLNKLDFDNIDNVCFIIYSRIYEWCGKKILRIIKKQYKNSTFVCYFGDLFETHNISLFNLKHDFSAVFTFDENEAKKYNFVYLKEPFSFDEKYLSITESNKVSFVGIAKDRLKEIINVYEILAEKKLDLDFSIFNVEDKKQVYKDKIVYNKYLSFEDLLYKVRDSKFVLEIMQKNAYSPTTRFPECVLYNKYLITNCSYFRDKNIPNVIYFENPEELKSVNFADFDLNKLENKTWISKFSVDGFINGIESYLNLMECGNAIRNF